MTALALIAAAPNCTDLYSIGTHGFAVPALTVQNPRAAQSGGAVEVALELHARNPNPYPLAVSSVDYAVTLQGIAIFNGTLPAQQIEPASDASLTVTGSVPLTSPALSGLLPGQSARYTLTGTLHLESPAGVPIDADYSMSGNVPVPAAASSGR